MSEVLSLKLCDTLSQFNELLDAQTAHVWAKTFGLYFIVLAFCIPLMLFVIYCVVEYLEERRNR